MAKSASDIWAGTKSVNRINMACNEDIMQYVRWGLYEPCYLEYLW